MQKKGLRMRQISTEGKRDQTDRLDRLKTARKLNKQICSSRNKTKLH